MTDYPLPFRIPTSAARDALPGIVTRVQDPRACCILTRYNKPVAAVVSMAELRRIWTQQDMEDIIHNGKRPAMFRFGRGGLYRTNAEAAEAIQQIQLDRRTEREVLMAASLDPVPGGELIAEVEAPVKRRWWRFWG